MRLTNRHACVALAALGCLAAAAGIDLALAQQRKEAREPAVAFVPHRAIYEFTLGSVRTEKSVTSLTGRMVYEFTGSTCEGWSQTMRFVTRTTAPSGAASVTDQRSTSWEDDAATRLRFSSSQYRDQRLVEQTAGTATRGASATDDIQVDITHPDRRKGAVVAGAMFPIQHSVKLIEAARRGQQSFTADYYDGADGGEKIYVITAQIGKQLPAGFNRTLPRKGQVDKLDGLPAWPVMLSYYNPGSEQTDAMPVYEMKFVFFANGVSRRLVIDNGEYTMKGELTEFSFLDALPCKK